MRNLLLFVTNHQCWRLLACCSILKSSIALSTFNSTFNPLRNNRVHVTSSIPNLVQFLNIAEEIHGNNLSKLRPKIIFGTQRYSRLHSGYETCALHLSAWNEKMRILFPSSLWNLMSPLVLSLIPNLKVTLRWFNFAQLCCNYFQTCWPPFLNIVKGLENASQHGDFGAESTGIDCADIIFNRAGRHLDIRVDVFRSLACPNSEFRVWKLSQSIGLQLCSIVQQTLSIVRAFFPRFEHFLQICTHEINGLNSSP